MYKAVIDLKNKNALVALAYIKTNENPVDVFCTYTLYVLSKATECSLRVDEVHDKILDKFGLDLPIQMINLCSRILKRANKIENLPNGAGLHLLDNGFDSISIDNAFIKLHEQETKVLESMAAYLHSNFNLTWDLEYAKNCLSVFLDEQGNAASMFLDDKILESNKLSPSWYVGKYIYYLQQQSDCIEKQYLLDIINGMMIYQGVYYTDNFDQNRNQKFKGTHFYLDTKLLLRYMGYSFPAFVQATRELVELLTKEYEGKVMVFEQTISEVSNALSTAGTEFKKKKIISNFELRGYVSLNPSGAELLEEKAEAISAIMDGSIFGRCEIKDWANEKYHRYYIDEDALQKHIQSERPLWRSGTIHNDVEVVKQINILRKSDYSVRYGGKNKLPVFVTTNTGLVYSVKSYAEKRCEESSETLWNPHALPVISDNMLLFRLWVPVAKKYSKLPSITLARYAYAAQNIESNFFEKIKEKANAYQTETHIDFICVSDARRRKLEDIIVKNTEGDSDLLTEEVYATSVDELVALENSNLRGELDQAQEDILANKKIIEQQNIELVGLTAKPFVGKMGIYRLLLFIAEFWWIELAVLISIPSIILDVYFIDANVWMVSFVPVIVEVIGKFLETQSNNRIVLDWLVKPVIKKSADVYSKKIINTISEKDDDFKKEVLQKYYNDTKSFAKYSNYLPPIDSFIQ